MADSSSTATVGGLVPILGPNGTDAHVAAFAVVLGRDPETQSSAAD